MTAAINDICMRSPIACVNDGAILRVYQLANDGSIREAQYEGRWAGGMPDNTVGRVKLSSPLAAASTPKLRNIRVYGVDNENKLYEMCFDKGESVSRGLLGGLWGSIGLGGGDDVAKGWYPGLLNGKFEVAPFSGVGACLLEPSEEDKDRDDEPQQQGARKKPKICIFAQDKDGEIVEYLYDTDWHKGQKLGKAMPGTSIAATSFGKDDKSMNIRVYYQLPDKRVIEMGRNMRDEAYRQQSLSFPCEITRTPLDVVSWGGNSPHVRLYYASATGEIREKCHDHEDNMGSESWYDGNLNQEACPASYVGALHIGGSALRCYIQNGVHVTAFTEMRFDENNWQKGQDALPPA